jgi:hypothetical protein
MSVVVRRELFDRGKQCINRLSVGTLFSFHRSNDNRVMIL